MPLSSPQFALYSILITTYQREHMLFVFLRHFNKHNGFQLHTFYILFIYSFYLRDRGEKDRKRPRKKFPIYSCTPQKLITEAVQAEVKRPELNTSPPYGWQESNYFCQHLLPCRVHISCNTKEISQDSNSGTVIQDIAMLSDSLPTMPNVHFTWLSQCFDDSLLQEVRCGNFICDVKLVLTKFWILSVSDLKLGMFNLYTHINGYV